MLETAPGQKIMDTTIVVFDLETTGFSPRYGDEIVEIGAIKARGSEIISEFHSMVNPLRPISAGASAVNGITNDMVKDAPVIENVLPDFLGFIGDCPIVVHNAKFDLPFIAWKAAELGLPECNSVVFDTLLLSRSLHPEFPNHKLGEIVRRLGIENIPQHRAVSDATATWEIFNKLITAQRYDITTGVALRIQGGPAPWPQYESEAMMTYDTPASEFEILIQRTIVEKKNVTIEYKSGYNGTSTIREIKPIKLIRRTGKSYLIADCLLRKEQRTFRMDRIINLSCV